MSLSDEIRVEGEGKQFELYGDGANELKKLIDALPNLRFSFSMDVLLPPPGDYRGNGGHFRLPILIDTLPSGHYYNTRYKITCVTTGASVTQSHRTPEGADGTKVARKPETLLMLVERAIKEWSGASDLRDIAIGLLKQGVPFQSLEHKAIQELEQRKPAGVIAILANKPVRLGAPGSIGEPALTEARAKELTAKISDKT